MELVKLRSVTFLAAIAACSVAALAQASGSAGTISKTDAVFLKKAAAGGFTEIQLGTLATQKGSAEEVKKFGQKMVDDHTQLNSQLQPFAESAGLTPPTKLDTKAQEEYAKLNAMTGDNFDREYLSYMVKDHHEDLKDFRKEETATTNPSLKDAVSKVEAVIQEHTTMVEKLNKQLGGPVESQSGAM